MIGTHFCTSPQNKVVAVKRHSIFFPFTFMKKMVPFIASIHEG